MTVQVTAEDICRGIRYSNTHCPIARAVGRVKDEALVLVDPEILHVGAKEYHLPPAAQQFVSDFDAGQPVSPITFQVSDVNPMAT